MRLEKMLIWLRLIYRILSKLFLWRYLSTYRVCHRMNLFNGGRMQTRWRITHRLKRKTFLKGSLLLKIRAEVGSIWNLAFCLRRMRNQTIIRILSMIQSRSKMEQTLITSFMTVTVLRETQTICSQKMIPITRVGFMPACYLKRLM